MDSKDKETKRTRRPYRKPQLEAVRLVAEEAVLTSCKLAGGTITGPQNTNCKGGEPAATVVNQGS